MPALVPVDYDPFFDVAQQGPSDPNALVRLGPGGVTPAAAPNALQGALEAAYGLTGVPDLQAAYAAAARGEALPALGQGAAGAAALIPALKSLAAAPFLAAGIKEARNALAPGENALLGALSKVNKAPNVLTGAPMSESSGFDITRLPVKRATEDVNEVVDATFNYGHDAGTTWKPISELNGGVDLSQPGEAKRIEKLQRDLTGDNGYISRLIVDDQGNVVEGQHRLEALRLLGAQNVPVHIVKDLANGVDTEALDAAIKSAQPMPKDNRSQLIRHLLEAVNESGSPAAVSEGYVAPKGYEGAWDAALKTLQRPDPIRAYHGSPYDFDAFDASKIGTGQGAQTYGYGLYTAEAEPVAESYIGPAAKWKYGTANAQTIYDRLNNQSLERGLDNEGWEKLNAQRGFWEKVVLGRSPRSIIEDARINPDEYGDAELAFINSLNPDRFKRLGGHMYEVNINAHPDTFLHWDKPLSDQPEAVKQALESTEYPYHAERLVGSNWMEKLTGSDLINRLAGDHASASEALRAAGINGIKYLDQGSRDARPTEPQIGGKPLDFNDPLHLAVGILDSSGGDRSSAIQKLSQSRAYYKDTSKGAETHDSALDLLKSNVELPKITEEDVRTHNYVVFDPKIIEIIKKYGLAPLIAGGAFATGGDANAATHLVPVDHDPFKTEEP